ncbi:rhomboid family intramembrane serine protease [Streptomyces sp. MS06]|uniref:rhomboid family intramembrane serine protease n=1 Tax=Streptomyces sp. MS06 TaxID=3385974 RepID=UPI0039A30467
MDTESTVTTCYRHPKVESYVRCTRCDRFICPGCMREAAVGHQCVECVKEGSRSVRQARTVFGGRVSAVPAVTYALIALNLLAYVAELALPDLVDRFAMLGAPAPGRVWAGVAHGEWYRLVTGAFLHLSARGNPLGILHLVLNMAALWSVGRQVEPQLGRTRFGALFLLSVLGGSVAVLLLAPREYTVGASGGIFGVAAAAFVFARRPGGRGVDPGMALLLVWLLVSARFTSWEAHVGGLVTGAVVAVAYAYAPRGRRRGLVQAGVCTAVLVVLVLCAWGKVSELTGGAA